MAILSAASACAQARPDRLLVLPPPRVALVFGNDAYRTAPLHNAVADAGAMRQALSQVGFDVTVATNLTLRGMNEAVSRFLDRIPLGSVAAFYYAGHGVQIQGENFLIPVDFQSTREADVRYLAFSASRLLELIEERKPRVKLVILDACRNNPFQRTRQLGGGLAPLEGGEGTIVAYAAEHGKTAADDSLFRRSLAAELVKPGVDLRDVFRRVKERVFAGSGRRQLPYVYEGLVGRVVLSEDAAGPGPEPPPETQEVAAGGQRPLQVDAQPALADEFRRLKAQGGAIVESVRITEENLRKDGLALRPEIAAAREEAASLAAEAGRALTPETLRKYREALDRLSRLVYRRPLNGPDRGLPAGTPMPRPLP